MDFTNINKDNAGLNNINTFNAYHENRYLDSFINGYAFIFITRPMLFIEPLTPNESDYTAVLAHNNMRRDPKFAQYLDENALNENDRLLPRVLSYNNNYLKSNFIPMFTNGIKNFDLPDINLDQFDGFQTKQGFRQVLPSHKTMSDAAGSVTFNINETSNLDFIKLITLWVEYIDKVTNGTFNANPDMIIDGKLDYTSSIFYFVTEPDGRTLKHWTKLTGSWPTSIPGSPLSYRKGTRDLVEIDVNFVYSMREDNNPLILEEFNKISMKLNISEVDGLFTSREVFNPKLSPFLNPELLRKSPYTSFEVTSNNREPLIIYKKLTNDKTYVDDKAERYELIFGQETFDNKASKAALNPDNTNKYIYDTSEFFGSDELDKTGGLFT